jgi:hypothetical protein
MNSQNGELSRQDTMCSVVCGDKVSHIFAMFLWNTFRKDPPERNHIYAWHEQFS